MRYAAGALLRPRRRSRAADSANGGRSEGSLSFRRAALPKPFVARVASIRMIAGLLRSSCVIEPGVTGGWPAGYQMVVGMT